MKTKLPNFKIIIRTWTFRIFWVVFIVLMPGALLLVAFDCIYVKIIKKRAKVPKEVAEEYIEGDRK